MSEEQGREKEDTGSCVLFRGNVNPETIIQYVCYHTTLYAEFFF